MIDIDRIYDSYRIYARYRLKEDNISRLRSSLDIR
jgi:hypothetical protein